MSAGMASSQSIHLFNGNTFSGLLLFIVENEQDFSDRGIGSDFELFDSTDVNNQGKRGLI